MYFVRTFQNAEAWKTRFGEFKCTNCGHVEWVEVTENFTTEPKECPTCKSMGKDDFKENLITKKNLLEHEKEKIQNEIDQIISELDIVKMEETK